MSQVRSPVYGKVVDVISDFFFPKYCVGCRVLGQWCCDDCLVEIESSKEWLCLVCEDNFSKRAVCAKCHLLVPLEGVIIGASYEGFLREAIRGLKYDFIRDIALDLADFLVDVLMRSDDFRSLEIAAEKVVFLSMPLSDKRQNWRGFNQVDLVARQVVDKLGWGVLEAGLKRVWQGKVQMELERQDRFENVLGVFSYEGVSLVDKVVVVFDDVLTSGASMMSVASVLKDAGARQVWGCVLAHGS